MRETVKQFVNVCFHLPMFSLSNFCTTWNLLHKQQSYLFSDRIGSSIGVQLVQLQHYWFIFLSWRWLLLHCTRLLWSVIFTGALCRYTSTLVILSSTHATLTHCMVRGQYFQGIEEQNFADLVLPLMIPEFLFTNKTIDLILCALKSLAYAI